MAVLDFSEDITITQTTGISKDYWHKLTVCPYDYGKGITIKEELTEFPGEDPVSVNIRSKETALNLIIALQKAIDLGWFKDRE